MWFLIILILVGLFVYTQSRKAQVLEGEFKDVTKK